MTVSIENAVFQGQQAIENAWGEERDSDARLLKIFEKCARKAAGEETGVIGWVKWVWDVGASAAGYGKEEKSVADKVAEYYRDYSSALKGLREKKLPLEKLSDEVAACGMHASITSGGSFLFHAIVAQERFAGNREITRLLGEFIDALSLDDYIEAYFLFESKIDEKRGGIFLYGQLFLVKRIARSPLMLPCSDGFTEDKCDRMIGFFVNLLDECERKPQLIEFFLARPTSQSSAIYQLFLDASDHGRFKEFVNRQMQEIPVADWPNKLLIVSCITKAYPDWTGLDQALKENVDEQSRFHANSLLDAHISDLYNSLAYRGYRGDAEDQ